MTDAIIIQKLVERLEAGNRTCQGCHDLTAVEMACDMLKSQAARIQELEARVKELEGIARGLLALEPDLDAKNGPCCYALDKACGYYLNEGCSCSNYDDAQQAGAWADNANLWIKQAAARAALNNTKEG